eukprot:GHUV01026058.1.p1 GENE.GHUV01026058.1~~GHUV01026058.1.p1  ORF type:complete len:312 (+),score=51.16 GHUV01026058.1:32-967(+)
MSNLGPDLPASCLHTMAALAVSVACFPMICLVPELLCLTTCCLSSGQHLPVCAHIISSQRVFHLPAQLCSIDCPSELLPRPSAWPACSTLTGAVMPHVHLNFTLPPVAGRTSYTLMDCQYFCAGSLTLIVALHNFDVVIQHTAGDGRLGLLIAQVLALKAPGRVTHIGRHPDKMSLVTGTVKQVVTSDTTAAEYQGEFDMVVEATGSASSIRTALALTKPMGTLVLKTTVSLNDPEMPGWSELANDIVVNEKVLVGSRCGPMDQALQIMSGHAEVRQLLTAMLHHEVPLKDGVEAMQLAQSKGVIKVHVVM